MTPDEYLVYRGQLGALARWANDDRTRGECLYCDIPLVTEGFWRYEMTQAERDEKKVARHWGKGLCNRCGKAVKRAEEANKVPGRRVKQMRAEEMLEEWDLLRSDGVTDLNVAAERIGTTRTALVKCLERARKRGDERGIYHTAGQLGGLSRQSVAGYSSRRAA